MESNLNQKRKFTVIAQLHAENNPQIITYVENILSTYSKALRETFYAIRNYNSFNSSVYSAYLQHKYGILTRTVNSIIIEAQTKLNSIKELRKYEKFQLEKKIIYIENVVIPKLQSQRDINCQKLRDGETINLQQHRNLKKKLVAKKNKLNKLKHTLSNLNYQIESGKYKICFGTKKLLKQDYNKFISQRDSQLTYIGRKNETGCNQLLQLTYDKRTNQFYIKLRKDFGENKNAEVKCVLGSVYFNHHKKEIIEILKNKTSPLSYKILKKNGRYYLYCTFEMERNSIRTSKEYGTIGLDFNKGFITVTETNEHGNMIRTDFIPYRFKQGNATKTDFQSIANKVVKLARDKAKDICVEDLNFSKKKAKTETKQGKKYNDMIHSLAYSEFIKCIELCAYRYSVCVIRVNPAWTSWIASKKYCPKMKLNVHIGASFVIARRGQGFQDEI